MKISTSSSWGRPLFLVSSSWTGHSRPFLAGTIGLLCVFLSSAENQHKEALATRAHLVAGALAHEKQAHPLFLPSLGSPPDPMWPMSTRSIGPSSCPTARDNEVPCWGKPREAALRGHSTPRSVPEISVLPVGPGSSSITSTWLAPVWSIAGSAIAGSGLVTEILLRNDLCSGHFSEHPKEK